jgi:hypothetical protein
MARSGGATKKSLYVKGVSVQQQSKNLAAKKNFA